MSADYKRKIFSFSGAETTMMEACNSGNLEQEYIASHEFNSSLAVSSAPFDLIRIKWLKKNIIYIIDSIFGAIKKKKSILDDNLIYVLHVGFQ